MVDTSLKSVGDLGPIQSLNVQGAGLYIFPPVGARHFRMVSRLVGGASSVAGFLVGLPFFRMQLLDMHTANHQCQAVDLIANFGGELEKAW